MLALDVYTSQVPEMFQRFSTVIGEEHWRKRVQQCKQEMKGNVFLREYLVQENEIAFQLNHLSELAHRLGRMPLAEAENHNVYPALALVVQTLSVLDASEKDDAERFCRRLHGAFKNPADMRGLRLELVAATHFLRRGSRISWPETTGTGTFDLLVEGDGHAPLEVECKSIGEDKGRRIHRRELIDFVALLKPHLRSTTSGLRGGLSVVVTVPDRLPSSHRERVDFAKELGRIIFAGSDCSLADGTTVRLTDFEVAQLTTSRQPDPRELRATVDAISGTNNRSAIVIGTREGGMLALTIQSRRDDALMTSVFDTLRDAAKRQLTGSRAGMLLTGLDGLDGEQLRSIAAQDQDSSQQPTALRVAVSQFLSSDTRNHIVGVGFVSRSALRPLASGLVESGGTAYYFPKRESSFWCDGYSGMFAWSSRLAA
ncbi:hypothetical protein [Burkholderia pseudomallei]|uniref:hypothetical protein n=1 Tax=Burkholderia pseudomallei TaxID=28450 RepID=UPI00053786B5|nr:hypothetical protein [Burkholderia pseudomallei]KGX39471.1 hypothetical protein Y043_2834 [Burkholderia pseudomallei MSHR2138]